MRCRRRLARWRLKANQFPSNDFSTSGSDVNWRTKLNCRMKSFSGPAPWKPVDGGLGFDILAELHVPADFRPPEWFDRLNSVWWFAALVRLIGNPHAVVPVIASHPFAEMATMEGEPNIRTMEVYRRRLKLENPTCQLSINSLGWIKD